LRIFDKHPLTAILAIGGYVFAPVHTIQADVPVENMLAMWETVAEYKRY
jgi:uroporphyrinogen decarboxylase